MSGFSISTQHTPEQEVVKRVYCGVWYKPWTWLRWRRVRVITSMSLVSVSLVKNPPPGCEIQSNLNGDVFPAKLDEIAKCREQMAEELCKNMGVPRHIYDGPLGEKEDTDGED